MIATVFAGCGKELGPPSDELLSTAPTSIVGIEPFCAEVAAQAATPPAAPAAEGAPRRAVTMMARHVAMGRAARSLGGDALLAPMSREYLVTQAIVADRDAIELLVLGKTDFALAGAQLSQRDRELGLRETLLGVELFALVVAEDTPLPGLRADVLRRLLTGAVRDRAELGLPAGPVVLGVPADREQRDRAAHLFIAGDPFAATAVPIDGDRGAFDLLLREPFAIAVVHVAAMAQATGIRPLEIDGARPTLEAFALGIYPYGVPLQLITAGEPRQPAAQIIESVRNGDSVLAPERLLTRH